MSIIELAALLYVTSTLIIPVAFGIVALVILGLLHLIAWWAKE